VLGVEENETETRTELESERVIESHSSSRGRLRFGVAVTCPSGFESDLFVAEGCAKWTAKNSCHWHALAVTLRLKRDACAEQCESGTERQICHYSYPCDHACVKDYVIGYLSWELVNVNLRIAIFAFWMACARQTVSAIGSRSRFFCQIFWRHPEMVCSSCLGHVSAVIVSVSETGIEIESPIEMNSCYSCCNC
jgi:hypothetical protein